MLRWWDSLFESLDFLGVVGVALTSMQNMSERRIVVKYVSSGYKCRSFAAFSFAGEIQEPRLGSLIY